MDCYTFRLRPGQDLLRSIQDYVSEHAVSAGCVLSGVGSLTQATLRLANQFEYNQYQGHFEIVAITGTVSTNGSHLHIAISDGEGHTTGGHLVPGCIIYTTAEIVLGVFPEIEYQRELCPDSGYAELVVYPHSPGAPRQQS